MKAKILGVNVDCLTMNDAVAQIGNLTLSKKPKMVATANAEMLMMADADAELKAILNAAALVTADGAGTVWAGRQLGYEVPERVAGVDLVIKLLEKGYKTFMFGAAEGIADAAAAKAEKAYRANIAGTNNGYFTSADEQTIINKINASGAQILLVALGVPKQEKWIYNNLSKLQVPVSIGVGGTLDVLAGKVKRAPLWMQRARLEWLYRALKEPSRAGRLAALPKFVIKVLRGEAQ